MGTVATLLNCIMHFHVASSSMLPSDCKDEARGDDPRKWPQCTFQCCRSRLPLWCSYMLSHWQHANLCPNVCDLSSSSRWCSCIGLSPRHRPLAHGWCLSRIPPNKFFQSSHSLYWSAFQAQPLSTWLLKHPRLHHTPADEKSCGSACLLTSVRCSHAFPNSRIGNRECSGCAKEGI